MQTLELPLKNHEGLVNRFESIHRLGAAHAWLTGCFDKSWWLISTMLDLESVVEGRPLGNSTLNGNGVPLQLCLTLTLGSPKLRMLADPASDSAQSWNRYERARKALAATLQLNGTQAIEGVVGAFLDYFGPEGRADSTRFSNGVFWLGAASERPGVAVYLDGAAFGPESVWRQLEGWFPQGQKVACLAEGFRPHCKVSSLGLEGVDEVHHRIKVYLRSLGEPPVGLLGNWIPAVEGLFRAGCCRELLGESSCDPEEIVYSVGLSPTDGAVLDAKIDIGCGGLNDSSEELAGSISQCCRQLGLTDYPLAEMIRRFDLTFSFVGFGVDQEGNKRLNVYLKSKAP